MSNRTPFQKPYTSAHDLVSLLQSRGLTIVDSAKAERYLEFIGYYRLSAYMYPLLQVPKVQHHYKPDTSFDQVMMLYRFDKKLRLLIFNEIEKIEVAVRSAIVNIGSDMTGNPFWMTDSMNFIDAAKFRHTMDLIDTELHRSREDFIVHFKQTYSDAYPPAWILAEVLPFGVITNIFSNIKTARIKKSIARKFGLQVAPFESWLTIVTLTRNSCCHHARVWNMQNTIRPMIPNRMAGNWITLPTDALRIYFNLCIIKYFLNIISPHNDMKAKIEHFLQTIQPLIPQPWASPVDGRMNRCGNKNIIMTQNKNKQFNTYKEGLDLEFLREYCMEHGEKRTFLRGETLEEAGEPAQWVAFVERGCFKYMVHNDEEGKDYCTGFAFEGEFVADFPYCLDGDVSEVSIEADMPCEVRVISGQELQALFDNDPKMAKMDVNILKNLFKMVYGRDLDHYRYTARSRYRRLLERCPQVVQMLSLKDIASFLNITPIYLSKLRKEITFGKT